jgi:hypothetical protein
MGERFATSEQDFEGRMQHWRDGLSLVSTPAEWLVGKGLGRFPKSYYFGAPDAGIPGSYRVGNEEGNAFLVLSGPRHPFSFGELFRVGERVPITPGPYTLTFDARAAAPARLHIEICQQHLLYNGACAFPPKPVTIEGASWQAHIVTLDGRDLDGGPWYAPRLALFAFAVEAQGLRVDLDNVSLVGPSGRNLVDNGDFGRGMARWFMVSEKIHLPWHIKSLPLNVLFDQGVIGLVLFIVLVGGTLFRLVAGRARGHPLAAVRRGLARRFPGRGRFRQPARRAARGVRVLSRAVRRPRLGRAGARKRQCVESTPFPQTASSIPHALCAPNRRHRIHRFAHLCRVDRGGVDPDSLRQPLQQLGRRGGPNRSHHGLAAGVRPGGPPRSHRGRSRVRGLPSRGRDSLRWPQIGRRFGGESHPVLREQRRGDAGASRRDATSWRAQARVQLIGHRLRHQ